MSTRLNELAALLQCPACGASSWAVTGAELAGSITCGACGAGYASARGVLDLGDADEAPEVTAERAAVRSTESRADLGGIEDAGEDLTDAQGELRDALLALRRSLRRAVPHGSRRHAARTIPARNLRHRSGD